MSKNRPLSSMQTILLTLPLIGVAIWLGYEFQTSLNSDHAWLIEAAKRLLNGGTMSQNFYDPNPPLSVLLYIPSAYLEWFLKIPPAYAHYIFTTLCLIGFSILTYRILRSLPLLDFDQCLIMIFAFICANTFLTMSGSFYFGERDQFVFMGLFALCLIQYAITHNISINLSPAFLYLTIMVSTIFILLKPHYLVIPAIMFLHRTVISKRIIQVITDKDFFILSLTVSIYAIILLVFFSDYLFEVFPVFFKYYLSVDNPDAPNIAFIFLSIIITAAIAYSISGVPLKQLKPAYSFLFIALLCCLLFWIQMKGIYYQLLPTIGFGFISIALFMDAAMRHYYKHTKYNTFIIMGVLGISGLYFTPGLKTAPPHDFYKETPLYQIVDRCAPDCSFFLSSENIDIIHQIALYSGATHASRFPALWWLPEILENGNVGDEKRLTGFVIDDFQKYKPEFIIVSNNLELAGRENFNLINYLSKNPEFSNFMQNYQQIEILEDNRNNYMNRKIEANNFDIHYTIYQKITR